MLVTLTFLLFNAPVLYAAKVIFCQDPSIRYSPGWYAGYSTPTQDIYLETNDTDAASLRLVLPSNATSVEYVGYKRAGGSLYGYCIDCENDGSYELQTVNASDPSVGTDEAAALQSIIFTMTLDPSKQHTLVVYNLPDQQFNNSGKINLDHLLVQVPDSNVPDETTAGPRIYHRRIINLLTHILQIPRP
ncbi:hypothetical protein FB45DRAFT_1027875 [Roridomyces roridus]|uniref:Uncharacterized protein n=1 Tax=Roridomyces roridus TaxID=1738132 RepID=A0AAD7BTX4_9AGAR|nr:hypothetical protein FB45DRAFT_1027875 [Roridomyces roridus]